MKNSIYYFHKSIDIISTLIYILIASNSSFCAFCKSPLVVIEK